MVDLGGESYTDHRSKATSILQSSAINMYRLPTWHSRFTASYLQGALMLSLALEKAWSLPGYLIRHTLSSPSGEEKSTCLHLNMYV